MGSEMCIRDRLKASASFPDGELSTIDGVRVDYSDGFGLIRPSNTTPILVLRFEGDSQTALERIQTSFKSALLSIDEGLNIPF